MTAPVLELRDVGKTFPAPTRVTALADVWLTVAPGETVAITGPSGSGKSTLLTLLGTLERPTTGTVLIAGTDTSQLPDRWLSGLRAWRIGFVFQQFHLLDHLSVLDNVATGLLYRGWSARQRREAAARALERVGLQSRARHRPPQLSGGERQRTAIARAVAGQPDIVLADEPTGNLDSATSAEIITLIAGLAGPSTTVLVITHDAAVASAMHREVRLRDGRIVHDSGPAMSDACGANQRYRRAGGAYARSDGLELASGPEEGV
jgi:putative ABC transport system ATP-binding protein